MRTFKSKLVTNSKEGQALRQYMPGRSGEMVRKTPQLTGGGEYGNVPRSGLDIADEGLKTIYERDREARRGRLRDAMPRGTNQMNAKMWATNIRRDGRLRGEGEVLAFLESPEAQNMRWDRIVARVNEIVNRGMQRRR